MTEPERDHEHEEELPAELRRALDAWQPAPAREEFRAQLAARFVTGESERLLSDDEQRAVEERLSEWRPAPARPEFRAALREAFIRGALRVRRTPIYSFRRVVVALATAAAALFLLFGPWGVFGPTTVRVVDYTPGATLVIDGEAVPFEDSRSLMHTLEHGGCCLETSTEQLSMVWIGEGVLLELPGNSKVRFRPRSGNGDLVLELESGGVYVSIKGTHEGRITVITPDAEIVMKGESRSLGVDLVEGGTCLCILDGGALMRSLPNGSVEYIESNTTAYARRGVDELKLWRGEVHHLDPLVETAERSERYLY